MKKLDRIILGDNQFFGINHMSSQKSQDLSERFNDDKEIINVIDTAIDSDINAFMFNSNDRVATICEHFISNQEKYSKLVCYPSIPYPHKYANLVTEKGILPAINHVLLSGKNINSFVNTIFKGSSALITKDLNKIMKLLIDLEMRNFLGLNTKVIFLQNIITDLILGLGIKDLFIDYGNYIREKYNVEPGFITMNAPELVKFLDNCGINNPIICTSLNQIGYLMSPNKKLYEKILNEYDCRLMAMSIFASGAISPEPAIKYLFDNYNIDSIVFGASSKKNIMHTKSLITKYSQ